MDTGVLLQEKLPMPKNNKEAILNKATGFASFCIIQMTQCLVVNPPATFFMHLENSEMEDLAYPLAPFLS
jgi:hypothetical protein